MKPKVAVLIPTLNEEATIGQVIDKIPVRVLSDEGHDTVIYVIDADSEDATQQKVIEKDAVVLHVKRPWKGSAMQFALASVCAEGKRADRPKLSSISDGLEIASFLLKRRVAPGGRRAL
ncbi:MAG: glycosyltransferase [Halobacteriota archaeon]|jgi:glycosyltransferase involved in cell wall biosynthesis